MGVTIRNVVVGVGVIAFLFSFPGSMEAKAQESSTSQASPMGPADGSLNGRGASPEERASIDRCDRLYEQADQQNLQDFDSAVAIWNCTANSAMLIPSMLFNGVLNVTVKPLPGAPRAFWRNGFAGLKYHYREAYDREKVSVGKQLDNIGRTFTDVKSQLGGLASRAASGAYGVLPTPDKIDDALNRRANRKLTKEIKDLEVRSGKLENQIKTAESTIKDAKEARYKLVAERDVIKRDLEKALSTKDPNSKAVKDLKSSLAKKEALINVQDQKLVRTESYLNEKTLEKASYDKELKSIQDADGKGSFQAMREELDRNNSSLKKMNRASHAERLEKIRNSYDEKLRTLEAERDEAKKAIREEQAKYNRDLKEAKSQVSSERRGLVKKVLGPEKAETVTAREEARSGLKELKDANKSSGQSYVDRLKQVDAKFEESLKSAKEERALQMKSEDLKVKAEIEDAKIQSQLTAENKENARKYLQEYDKVRNDATKAADDEVRKAIREADKERASARFVDKDGKEFKITDGLGDGVDKDELNQKVREKRAEIEERKNAKIKAAYDARDKRISDWMSNNEYTAKVDKTLESKLAAIDSMTDSQVQARESVSKEKLQNIEGQAKAVNSSLAKQAQMPSDPKSTSNGRGLASQPGQFPPDNSRMSIEMRNIDNELNKLRAELDGKIQNREPLGRKELTDEIKRLENVRSELVRDQLIDERVNKASVPDPKLSAEGSYWAKHEALSRAEELREKGMRNIETKYSPQNLAEQTKLEYQDTKSKIQNLRNLIDSDFKEGFGEKSDTFKNRQVLRKEAFERLMEAESRLTSLKMDLAALDALPDGENPLKSSYPELDFREPTPGSNSAQVSPEQARANTFQAVEAEARLKISGLKYELDTIDNALRDAKDPVTRGHLEARKAYMEARIDRANASIDLRKLKNTQSILSDELRSLRSSIPVDRERIRAKQKVSNNLFRRVAIAEKEFNDRSSKLAQLEKTPYGGEFKPSGEELKLRGTQVELDRMSQDLKDMREGKPPRSGTSMTLAQLEAEKMRLDRQYQNILLEQKSNKADDFRFQTEKDLKATTQELDDTNRQLKAATDNAEKIQLQEKQQQLQERRLRLQRQYSDIARIEEFKPIAEKYAVIQKEFTQAELRFGEGQMTEEDFKKAQEKFQKDPVKAEYDKARTRMVEARFGERRAQDVEKVRSDVKHLQDVADRNASAKGPISADQIETDLEKRKIAIQNDFESRLKAVTENAKITPKEIEEQKARVRQAEDGVRNSRTLQDMDASNKGKYGDVTERRAAAESKLRYEEARLQEMEKMQKNPALAIESVKVKLEKEQIAAEARADEAAKSARAELSKTAEGKESVARNNLKKVQLRTQLGAVGNDRFQVPKPDSRLQKLRDLYDKQDSVKADLRKLEKELEKPRSERTGQLSDGDLREKLDSDRTRLITATEDIKSAEKKISEEISTETEKQEKARKQIADIEKSSDVSQRKQLTTLRTQLTALGDSVKPLAEQRLAQLDIDLAKNNLEQVRTERMLSDGSLKLSKAERNVLIELQDDLKNEQSRLERERKPLQRHIMVSEMDKLQGDINKRGLDKQTDLLSSSDKEKLERSKALAAELSDLDREIKADQSAKPKPTMASQMTDLISEKRKLEAQLKEKPRMLPDAPIDMERGKLQAQIRKINQEIALLEDKNRLKVSLVDADPKEIKTLTERMASTQQGIDQANEKLGISKSSEAGKAPGAVERFRGFAKAAAEKAAAVARTTAQSALNSLPDSFKANLAAVNETVRNLPPPNLEGAQNVAARAKEAANVAASNARSVAVKGLESAAVKAGVPPDLVRPGASYLVNEIGKQTEGARSEAKKAVGNAASRAVTTVTDAANRGITYVDGAVAGKPKLESAWDASKRAGNAARGVAGTVAARGAQFAGGVVSNRLFGSSSGAGGTVASNLTSSGSGTSGGTTAGASDPAGRGGAISSLDDAARASGGGAMLGSDKPKGDWMMCLMAGIFTFQAQQRIKANIHLGKGKAVTITSINDLFSRNGVVDPAMSTLTTPDTTPPAPPPPPPGPPAPPPPPPEPPAPPPAPPGPPPTPNPPDGTDTGGDGGTGTQSGAFAGADPYAQLKTKYGSLDALSNCTDLSNCGRLSGANKFATPGENSLIAAAGGVGNLLEAIPMSPAEIISKAENEGLASAMAQVVPNMGPAAPAVAQFLSDVEAEGDLDKLGDLLPKDDLMSGVDSSKLSLGGAINSSSKNSDLNQLGISGSALPNLSIVDMSNAPVRMPAAHDKGPDIWHKGTDQNLFQIVSSATRRASPRVLAY